MPILSKEEVDKIITPAKDVGVIKETVVEVKAVGKSKKNKSVCDSCKYELDSRSCYSCVDRPKDNIKKEVK